MILTNHKKSGVVFTVRWGLKKYSVHFFNVIKVYDGNEESCMRFDILLDFE